MTSTPPRLSNPWLVLATLLVVYIFSAADRYLITGLVGPIQQEFGLSDGFMGLLMGPAFVLLYVLCGVPLARLADRSSRVRIIGLGCVAWSACTMATAFATGPVTLALARIGVGIGEAAFVAPAWSLLAAYFAPGRRGMAFAILGLATYAGQIVGQAGGPVIAAGHGWRTAYLAVGAPGVLIGLLTLVLIREPRRTVDVAKGTQVPFAAMLRELAGSRAYVLMMLAFGFGTLSGVAFGYWGPELFARAYSMDPVAAKSAFAVNFGLAGLAGMLAFGALSDRMTRLGTAWPLRLSAIALFAATALTMTITWLDSYQAAILVAIPCGLLGGGWSVGCLATLQLILPDRYRAAAAALFNAATTLIGFFLGPWLTGEISGALGNSGHSLRMGLSAVMPVGFLGALLIWLASSRIEQSRARLAEA